MISMLSKLMTLLTLADARVHAKVLRMMIEGKRIPLWGKMYALSWRTLVSGACGSLVPTLTLEQYERVVLKVIEHDPKRYRELIRVLLNGMLEELHGSPIHLPAYAAISAMLEDLRVNLERDIGRCSKNCQEAVDDALGTTVSRLVEDLANGKYKTVKLDN